MTHQEFSSKGGSSKSRKKLLAVRKNLKKAREAKEKKIKPSN